MERSATSLLQDASARAWSWGSGLSKRPSIFCCFSEQTGPLWNIKPSKKARCQDWASKISHNKEIEDCPFARSFIRIGLSMHRNVYPISGAVVWKFNCFCRLEISSPIPQQWNPELKSHIWHQLPQIVLQKEFTGFENRPSLQDLHFFPWDYLTEQWQHKQAAAIRMCESISSDQNTDLRYFLRATQISVGQETLTSFLTARKKLWQLVTHKLPPFFDSTMG